MLTAKEAIQKLKDGNKKYLTESVGSGDVSPAVRLRTSARGSSHTRSLLPVRIHELFRRVSFRQESEICL